MRVAIVGSGFAGSILARILKVQGHEPLLLERSTHPRFAVGESSTPLAAICLERLAARYDLPDLHAIAAYGRWLDDVPHLRRGLKRGFTFYSHEPDRAFHNDAHNSHRLLVAASPADAIADAHWLRADVDNHLAQAAQTEGVEYVDRVALSTLEPSGNGWHLAGVRDAGSFQTPADFVVDASGPAGFVSKQLGIPSDLSGIPIHTRAVFGHFEGVRDFVELARADGAALPDGPYPDERAAVHHMIDEGWLWVLPFDHGVVSAGFVLEREASGDLLASQPPEVWQQVLARYPTLCRQFADARPVSDLMVTQRLQHRLERAAGSTWALLPHAFCFMSPMFSTGIAWSLLGVERLSLAFEGARSVRDLGGALQRYGALLNREAEHLGRLIGGAYRTRRQFGAFAEYTQVYFAAASFAEASQRLLDRPPDGESWAWEGFLGATDPVVVNVVSEASASGKHVAQSRTPDAVRSFADEIRRLIEPRNVAGLANPGRNRLYPVDLDALVDAAPLLGLTRAEGRAALPHLRGAPASA